MGTPQPQSDAVPNRVCRNVRLAAGSTAALHADRRGTLGWDGGIVLVLLFDGCGFGIGSGIFCLRFFLGLYGL